MAGGALSDGVPGTAVRPGRDVVSLAAGEPDTDTPAHITAAAAAISGEHHYGPAAGSTGLRTAVATQLATLAPPFTADDVQICMGTKHALYGFIKRVAGRQIGPDAPVGLRASSAHSDGRISRRTRLSVTRGRTCSISSP